MVWLWLSACQGPAPVTPSDSQPSDSQVTDDTDDSQDTQDTQDLTLELELVSTDRPLVGQATVSLPESWAADDAEIWLEFWTEGVAPLRTASQPGDATLALIGVRQDSTYTVEAVAQHTDGAVVRSAPTEFTSGSVDMGTLPDWSAAVGADLPGGLLLVGPAPSDNGDIQGPYLYGVDRAGHVVWAWEPELEGRVRGTRAPELQSDGTVAVFRAQELLFAAPDATTSRRLAYSEDIGVHHDAFPLPDGGAYLLGDEERELPVPDKGVVPVRGDTIVRVDDAGQVVWTWSAFDHIDTTWFPSPKSTVAGRDGAVDWTHGNSLIHDADQDLLIWSARHLNQVIAVDASTGEVAWTLGRHGDFELTGDGRWFDYQHAALLTAPDVVLLYDNGTEDAGLESRAVAYRIDTAAGTAEQVLSLDVGAFTSNVGDVDATPSGGVLATAAGIRADGVPARVIEFDATGAIVWQLELPGDHRIYRAELVDWVQPVE
jgi:hypothetical protein